MVLLLLLIVCCRAQSFTPNRMQDKSFRFRYVFDTTAIRFSYVDTSQHVPITNQATGYEVTQQMREIASNGADTMDTSFKKIQWQLLGANKNPISKNWIVQTITK